jgi:hypothetical protein
LRLAFHWAPVGRLSDPESVGASAVTHFMSRKSGKLESSARHGRADKRIES